MQAWERLGPYLKPYWKGAVLAPLLMVVEVTMDLMLPRLMQRIVDAGIFAGDMTVVWRTGLQMILFTLIGAVGGIGCTIFAVRVAMSYGADLRSGVYRKTQSLSFRNLDHLGTGQLITRLTSDVNQVQDAVLIALRILVRAPLLVVGSAIMAVITSPQLSVLLAILIPLLLTVLVLVIRHSLPLYAAVQARLDRLNTVIQENLSGMRVVKAFVRGDQEGRRFGAANDSLTDTSIRAMQLSAVVSPVVMLAMNFGIVAVIWFGGLQALDGAMTVGQIIAFVNYLRQTLFSLTMVSMLTMRLSRAQASAVRLAEVLESTPAVVDRPSAATGFAPAGQITFESVTFGYDEAEPALRDVSFACAPGQTVALLGATGSGKSSLIHLIPRFYDVTGGSVRVDGADVRDVRQADLRAAIGIALQEPLLFSGTVYENIRRGRPDATEAEIVAAAQAAQAHEFITALPAGYQTELGQRGVNLSGGQKQRLAIARALVRRPAILILDDSTSAVDVETEHEIQKALAELSDGPTSLVVAQRISTVLTADSILVLDGGRIAAQGTHAELLRSSPLYREIYDSQLGNHGAAGAGEVRHDR
jgi:ATP-binding cassette, subfamily B, multidrug efflux pump